MTRARTVLLAVIALGVSLVLAGCGKAVEGSYTLDKAEMKASMEAEIAKLPPAQQGFAKLGLALVESMSVTLTLEGGGKLKMTSTVPALEKGKPDKTETKEGSWKLDGNNVILTADGKPIQCARDGTKLRCQPDKKGEAPMTFVRS